MSNHGSVFLPGTNIKDHNDYDRSEFLQDEKDWFGAIELAVKEDDGQLLAILIESLKPPIEYLQYEFYLAVTGRHAAAVDCLLSSGAEIDTTICWEACSKSYRSTKMLGVLLAHGWDINGDLGRGGTALSFSITDEATVQWLLEHGANPNISRTSAWNPALSSTSGWILYSASGRSSVRVLDLLLSHGADPQRLVLNSAAAADFTEERRTMLERLIELGVDPNRGDYVVAGPHARGTPLHSALESLNLHSIRFLLSYGANPTIKNQNKNQYGGSSIKYAASSFIRDAERLDTGWQVPPGSQTQDDINRSVNTLAKYYLIWHAMYKSCGKGGRAFRQSLRDTKIAAQPPRPEPAPLRVGHYNPQTDRISYETSEQAQKRLC